MGLYNSDGSLAVTIVDGNKPVGRQAPDGSLNVVLDDIGGYGVHHPSGALRVNSSNGNSVLDSSGAYYINKLLGTSRPSSISIFNLVTYPDSIDQWSATGATVARNVANDPITGKATADRMVETANTSQHNFNSVSISFTSGKTYTLSCYVKYETAPYIQLLFGSAAFGANAWGNFNIQTGALETKGSAGTAAITDAGNGWYRISITAPATSTASSATAIFGANAGNMTRAASYAGSTDNTRLITKIQIEEASSPSVYVRPKRTFTGNTDNAIVGALRWDAWYHPTQDTIRTAMETSLGPSQYHWRLPFFAEETGANSVVISGTQADMDTEIGYAVESGLDYWAFFWYGQSATNGMKQGWDYFQASSAKNNINWCFYFSGLTPFYDDVENNLATIVEYMGQSNYQKTAGGRPIVFMYDDAAARTNLAARIVTFRAAVVGAGLEDPYIIFHQSTPSATVLTTYDFDATTTYAPIVSVTGARPYNQLDTFSRAVWDTQAAQNVDVVPSFHMGWDRRPRVENPVPWEGAGGNLTDYYYMENPEDISTHIDAILAWARANPTRTPEKVIIGYAWNENDEGGWIVPTLGNKTLDRDRLDALKAVLK